MCGFGESWLLGPGLGFRQESRACSACRVVDVNEPYRNIQFSSQLRFITTASVYSAHSVQVGSRDLNPPT